MKKLLCISLMIGNTAFSMQQTPIHSIEDLLCHERITDIDNFIQQLREQQRKSDESQQKLLTEMAKYQVETDDIGVQQRRVKFAQIVKVREYIVDDN